MNIEKLLPSRYSFNARRTVAFAFLPTLFLCIAATAQASEVQERAPAVAPEALLPEQTVFYLRYDGLADHKAGYDQTIMAESLSGEFGPLLGELQRVILDAIGPELMSEKMLAGVPPDQLLKVQSANRQIPALIEYLKQHGFVAGFEVIAPLGGRMQATFVFPNGGSDEHRAALFGGFRLLGLMTETDVREAKLGDRTVLTLDVPEPVKVACWREGPHVVLTIGTEDVQRTVDLVEGERKSLADSESHQRFVKFDDYETILNGWFDLEKLMKDWETRLPPAVLIMDKLGLKGLKNVRFHAGFEDRYVRSTVMVEMPEKREGLLRLISASEGLNLAQMPPIAPDSIASFATRFDARTLYEVVLDTIELGIGTASPKDLPEYKTELKRFESSLGVDLRKDVYDSLGNSLVVYVSPSEGALSTGIVVAVEARDAEKLDKSLKTLLNSLSATTDLNVALKTKTYRGVDYQVVDLGVDEFPFLPAYTIHDGWLVASFFPQPVQGYIFRTETDATRWHPPEIAVRAVERSGAHGEGAKAKLVAVSASDPRPSVKELLAFIPFVVKTISATAGGGGSNFDLSLIPNAQAAAAPLTPSASVVTDDGRILRMDGYSSIPIPAQLTGLNAYGFVIAAFAFRFGF